MVLKIEKLHEYRSTHNSHKDAQMGYCLPRIHMLGTNKKPCLNRRFVISWVLGGWPWGHMEATKGGPREDVTQAHIPHAIEPLLTFCPSSTHVGCHTRNDLANSCGCSSSQSHGRVTPSPVSDDTKWSGHETRRPAGQSNGF